MLTQCERRQVVRPQLPKPGFRGFESRRPLHMTKSNVVSKTAFLHSYEHFELK